MKFSPLRRKPVRSLLPVLTLLLLTLSMSGCSTPSNTKIIYQKDELRLEAGTQVDTQDGLYVAQVDETWYGPAWVLSLQKKYEALLDRLK